MIDKEEFISKIDGSFEDRLKESFVAGYWEVADIIGDGYGSQFEAEQLFRKWRGKKNDKTRI